ncbi:MAG: hypothetical protein HDS98_00475 [Bacteroidales bacterium]|nr:hypothetical protein [Bacteroidales bacterium]
MAINREYTVSITNSIEEISINIISIPEDRLQNILTKHFDHLNRTKDYIGAIALSVTLLIVLVTSDFKDKWLDPPTWRALFIFMFIASLGYTAYCIYNAIVHKDSVAAMLKDINGSQTKSHP